MEERNERKGLQHTRLFTLKSDNPPSELSVDVQSLFASDWMPSDNRVDVFHWFTTDCRTASPGTREVSLFNAGVNRFEGTKEGDELGR